VLAKEAFMNRWKLMHRTLSKKMKEEKDLDPKGGR
jgi:hypothetical protein